MNYRHIYHAGNFADVFKHIVLGALSKSFLRKDTPFCYLDTHAGIGCYDLTCEAAQKSKEYETGLSKILNAKNAPELVAEYISCIQKLNKNANEYHLYPGSPEIVKTFLRPNDRMVLCELHPDDYKTLKRYYAHKKQVAIHNQDAYQSLKSLLPPKEKRGLILIDPPYENKDEFSKILEALTQALHRFETGVYAIWYPIKDYQAIKRLHHTFKEKISRPVLNCELSIYPTNLSTHLNGSGMLIINPPYQIDQQLNTTLPWLWEALNIDKQGKFNVNFL